MEISEAGASGLSLNLAARMATQRALWEQFKANNVTPAVRAENVQAEIGDLLFGLQLTLDELQLYKARLLRALEMADLLEEELPPRRQERRPRRGGSGKGYQIGQLLWYTMPDLVRTPVLPVSEEHINHAGRIVQLANMCKSCGLALSPGDPCISCGEEKRDVVSRVKVTVTRGTKGIKAGEDLIEVSRDSMTAIVNPEARPPAVVQSRMPPRFPRYGEILKQRLMA